MCSGGLFHGYVPVRDPHNPADPRSNPAWSYRRSQVLHDPGMAQTQQAEGNRLQFPLFTRDANLHSAVNIYHVEEENGTEQGYWEKEPPPLRSEVARAIRQTASRKAAGTGDVPAELFKAGGETALDRMHRVCVAIWETGEWPEEWTFSTFIPLPKKGDLKQSENYRTTALVSHASKILLRIILERIRV